MKTFKRLGTFIKGYWKDTILTWVCVLLESVLEILVAFFLKFLLKGVENQDVKTVALWACILVLMALVAAVLGVLAGYWASSASAGFGKNLRESIYIKVQDYSFKNIDHFSASSIVTRTTTDVTNVQFSFMNIIRTVIRAPFIMIFALIMCFVTAPKLAWIFLIIIPILLFILIFIASNVHKIFDKVFTTYDNLNESVQEDVDGIRVVKSFGRKNYHTKAFNKVSDYIYVNYIKAERRLSFNAPFMNLAIYSAMILISYLGAKEIINNSNTTLQISDLTTLFTYVMMILMSLMMVSQVYVMIIISRNSTERILELLDEQSDIISPVNPIMEVKNGDVDFENVSFAYAENKNVLENVNLHFNEGTSVGIIGPTGSSKTTLVSLIARLYDVSSGSVKVGDCDVRNYDLQVLRDSVAVVLQKNVLFTGTIRDNLKWGKKDATDEEIWKACDIAQASEFLHSFPQGLDTVLVEGGSNVSGGQKQRLCIARALLKDPKVLILDDSTSACDTHTDSLIRQGLRDNRPDVTKFIIAQRVLSIKDCDVIIVMDAGGKIVNIGNNEELMQTSQVYQELYQSQLGGGDFDEAE